MTRMLQLEWSAYCASLGTKVKTENLRQAEAYRDAYVQMIADFGGRHICNLGHGVYPDTPLENVNIVNLNQVIGTTTNSKGEFQISAKTNDTLHFSFLGFKSIKVRVTNDWLKFGSSKIELTELALALEEVVVNQLKLTGYLEVDIKQVPIINNNYRYSISGLPNAGYEADSPGTVSKIIGSIFFIIEPT